MSKRPPSDPKPASATLGGQGAGVAAARAAAIEAAPDCVQALRDILKKPPRNAMAKLAAARELLRFAEAGTAAGDGGDLDPADLTPADVELMRRFLAERAVKPEQ